MCYRLRKVNLSPKIWILKKFFVSLQKITYTMMDICLDCQFYKHKETVLDGYKEECNGMILVPKYKTIEHHCTEHPKIFKKWWEANKNKTRENVDDVPKCFVFLFYVSSFLTAFHMILR